MTIIESYPLYSLLPSSKQNSCTFAYQLPSSPNKIEDCSLFSPGPRSLYTVLLAIEQVDLPCIVVRSSLSRRDCNLAALQPYPRSRVLVRLKVLAFGFEPSSPCSGRAEGGTLEVPTVQSKDYRVAEGDEGFRADSSLPHVRSKTSTSELRTVPRTSYYRTTYGPRTPRQS